MLIPPEWCLFTPRDASYDPVFVCHKPVLYRNGWTNRAGFYMEASYLSYYMSLLFFSRPRSEGWLHHGRTFSIYPSSVILIDSSTGSPVHVLMLSIQAVRGLPRLHAPGIVPCIVFFSRQLPCFLTV